MTYNSINFAYTGSYQSWVVPAGLYRIYVELAGAQGSYAITDGGGSYGSGALGGKLTTILTVTPGETLYFYPGGAASSYSAGWNGGGQGGYYGWNASAGGGGGGTDIRRGGTALGNRILVAGGGGGHGRNDAGNPGTAGGVGGGTVGGDGTTPNWAWTPGYGGTQSAGGAYGTPNNAVYDSLPGAGTLGQGGKGCGNPEASGGGGGGYYGGGGGASYHSGDGDHGGGGGGGGSGYDSTGVGTFSSGVNSGNGYITVVPLFSAFKYNKGGTIYTILGETLGSQKIRYNKNGVIYGIQDIATNDPLASPIRVKVGNTIRALPLSM